jgi:hypothetical protein
MLPLLARILANRFNTTAIGGAAAAVTYQVVFGEDTTIAAFIRIFNESVSRGNTVAESICIANKSRIAKVQATRDSEHARLLECEPSVLRDFEVHIKTLTGEKVELRYTDGGTIEISEKSISSDVSTISIERAAAVKKLCDDTATAPIVYVDPFDEVMY